MRACLLAVFLTLPLEIHALTPQDRGLAIAVKADEMDTGWGDQLADMEMILRDRQGRESHRLIRTRTLEIDGDGDKSLTIFDKPRDVKGTAFLSFTHATRPDDQWLFLPALKRVKRIASANKSGPFMGSEFAFEDLSSNEVDKYTYRWLREEKLDEFDTFVVERVPRYAHSGYTRQVVWVDQTIYRARKVEYYDRKGALLKTLTTGHYQRYLDRYWRPDTMEMTNHQTGKSTLLKWSDYRLNTGLGDRDFNKNALKRVR